MKLSEAQRRVLEKMAEGQILMYGIVGDSLLTRHYCFHMQITKERVKCDRRTIYALEDRRLVVSDSGMKHWRINDKGRAALRDMQRDKENKVKL